MTAHTKGPWTADGEEISDSRGFEIADVAETCILRRWDDHYPDARHWSDLPGETFIDRPVEEFEANVRLIAAAPELLEAAQQLIDADARDSFTLQAGPAFVAAVSALHAAIAKATTANPPADVR